MAKENHFKKWTPKEVKFLKDNYQDLTRGELAKELGRSFMSVKSKAKEQNLYKTKEARSKISQRPNDGQYKKGQRPLNYTEVGKIHEKLDKRTGNTYLYIKFKSEKGIHSVYNHMPLSYYNWEKVNGPVPEGMVLSFKDGDTFNCELSNLKLITMSENMLRNSGSINLSDGMVALYMAPRNKDLRKELLQNTDLIKLKRESIKLNREINERSKK
jgi:hypothetical protein